MKTMTKPRGPDFLIVGAQRAGTTWLHRALMQHPALWLTPVKELHYFDKPQIRRTILDAYERKRARLTVSKLLDPWHRRYWLGARSYKWYARLFHEAQMEGLLAGEATPAYATLGGGIFRRIKNMNPKVKLVFVMRDPIDRAWSFIKNADRKGRLEGSVTVDAALNRVRSYKGTSGFIYIDTITRLEAIFPEDQLHFCFFDDLRDRPASFIAELAAFLGVDPGKFADIPLPIAVNQASGPEPVPAEFERAMACDYLAMVRQLSERFEGPPQRWRPRYEALVNRSST